MTPQDHILASDKVTSLFGYWPSFHDAEIVWLRVDRRDSNLGDGPRLEALVHCFEMTSEVNAAGNYVLRHHVLVHFRFASVSELVLEDFNHQNVLWNLEVEQAGEGGSGDGRLSVRFNAIHGAGAAFTCGTAEVVTVQPCDADGMATRGG